MTYNELDKIVRKALNVGAQQDIEDINLVGIGLRSLQAMRIVSEMKKMGIKASYAQLMEEPYIKVWREKLIGGSQDISPAEPEIEAAAIGREAALTNVQYAYWVGRNQSQVLGGVSCHAFFEFRCQELDPGRLAEAWRKVQSHHPMLRAEITSDGKQYICTEIPGSLIVNDKRNEEGKEKVISQIREAYSHRVYEVERGKVAGLMLTRLTEKESVVHFDVDLLVADLKSIKIILDDFGKAYEEIPLSAQPDNWTFLHFADGCGAVTESRKTAKRYWQEQLTFLPGAPQLPLAKPSEHIAVPRFVRRNYLVSEERWQKLIKQTGKYEVTPAMVLMGMYSLVLERYSTVSEFLLNVPLFGRPLDVEKVENVVGDFTNILLMPVDASRQKEFIGFVKQLQAKFFEVMKHTAYSGTDVIRELGKMYPERKLIAPYIFSCDYDNTLVSSEFENTVGKLSYMSTQTPQVLLDFQVLRSAEGIMLCWDVVDEAFCEGVIDQMFDCYVQGINRLIDDGGAWNDEFTVTRDEFFKYRYENMQELGKSKRRCLHRGFWESVESSPNEIAVIQSDTAKQLTYAEMAEAVKQLSGLLQNAGVSQGDTVAVHLPKGKDQIIAVLAILSAGASYTPVGWKLPVYRIASMLESAGAKAVLSNEKGRVYLQELNVACIDIQNAKHAMAAEGIVYPDPEATAYNIFTSGSTGTANGVEMSHAGAWNTIADVNEKFIGEEHRGLANSALEFDLSVYDIFGILSRTGTIVVIGEEERRNLRSWLRAIQRYEITFLNMVPFLMDRLLAEAEETEIRLDSLRTVILSGDWIGLDLPKRLKAVAPHAQLIAMGGATEGAVWSNYYVVELPVDQTWKSIPYGKPLREQLYRVVDEKDRDCPDWVPGELWIGGSGVAKGYVGNERLTAERFLTWQGMRWYRTGDMGRYWSDGTIEFLGRKDTQIKLRGHRIELAEIESVLKKTEGIQNAVAAVLDFAGGRQLAAYVVNGTGENQTEYVKQQLKKYLPQYMIPDLYLFSAEIPSSSNGKVDRNAIQKILMENLKEKEVRYEEPVGRAEQRICGVWKAVLQMEQISRNDDFFQIGGDSLKAGAIMARLKDEELIPAGTSIELLFTASTIAALAERIGVAEEAEEDMETDTI